MFFVWRWNFVFWRKEEQEKGIKLILMLREYNLLLSMLRVMVNCFVNRDLDGKRFKNRNWHVFFNCDRHWFFNWNWNMLFHRVRHFFLNRNCYCFYDLYGDRFWHRHCHGIRLWYTNRYRVWYWYFHWLRYWNSYKKEAFFNQELKRNIFHKSKQSKLLLYYFFPIEYKNNIKC